MMNFDETKTMLAVDLVPQSAAHWLRVIVAVLAVGLGTTDIVISRFVHDPPGAWEKEPIFLIILGIGILFTKTVIELAKALLPWKK